MRSIFAKVDDLGDHYTKVKQAKYWKTNTMSLSIKKVNRFKCEKGEK